MTKSSNAAAFWFQLRAGDDGLWGPQHNVNGYQEAGGAHWRCG